MFGNMSSRDCYLWCMSMIYLFAFASLYVQIPGLYGDNGILPAKLVVKAEPKSWKEFISDTPSLLSLAPKLGLSTQTAMDLLCLSGIIISFICVVSRRQQDVIGFSLLWILYFSLYQVGQTFLWFQWDILLLEAGFLTILVAPLNLPLWFVKKRVNDENYKITFWLVKWLLFRLMFASGVVKLTSECPTWWGLTALNYHYETQCIPTPLAWYGHQLPEWLQRLSVVATYVIEMAVPWLFFLPIHSLKMFAFWTQIVFQVAIILTGNYTFFNLLTITLCLSLLDDQSINRKGYSIPIVGKLQHIGKKVVSFVVFGLIIYMTVMLFDLKVDWKKWTLNSRVDFSIADLNRWLEKYVPYSIWFGAISLALQVTKCVISSMTNGSTLQRIWSIFQCGILSFLAFGLFAISLVPHTAIESGTRDRLLRQYPVIHDWYIRTDAFQITSSYGLFRSMTGVGGRPEVIIEGSNDMEKWKPYEFQYKPGDISRRPPIVAPHQPRLDWQMWFAALGSYQHNPWFLNLIYRILQGKPEVLELIGGNPFPEKPPKYVRAQLYHYHFTHYNTDSERYSKQGNYWTRVLKGTYLPIVTKDDPGLVKYLTETRIIQVHKQDRAQLLPPNMLTKSLTWVRNLVGQMEGFNFVLSLFVTSNVLNYVVPF